MARSTISCTESRRLYDPGRVLQQEDVRRCGHRLPERRMDMDGIPGNRQKLTDKSRSSTASAFGPRMIRMTFKGSYGATAVPLFRRTGQRLKGT